VTIKKKIDIKKIPILVCIKATKMSSMIVSANEFNTKNIVYTNPKTNSVGGKSIGILNSAVKKSLYINTPMLLTYGATYFDQNKDKDVSVSKKDNSVLKYDMSLQLPREEFATNETREFLRLMKELDEKILEDAAKNSVDWFGKKKSKEILKDNYRSILKYPLHKDGELKGEPDVSRAPTIKVKLPMWDGKYTFKVFDAQNDNELVFPDEFGSTPESFITKGSEVCCVIQCGGIYVADGKFGVTWKLYQASVKKPEKLEDNKCYVKMIDSSAEEPAQTQKKQTLYDSDGEDETNVLESTKESVELEINEETIVQEATSEVFEAPKPQKKAVKGKK
jgi:hypothetical protein